MQVSAPSSEWIISENNCEKPWGQLPAGVSADAVALGLVAHGGEAGPALEVVRGAPLHGKRTSAKASIVGCQGDEL